MNSSFERRITRRERVILANHINQRPVKVGALARELGIDVKSASLPATVSGEIRPSPTDPTTFQIRVNKFEQKRRQRFTVAHEIAHYLLHRDLIGDGITDDVLYRSSLSNTIEREANQLAADILMPRSSVKLLRDKFSHLSSDTLVETLASEFDVSRSAMRIRLGLM